MGGGEGAVVLLSGGLDSAVCMAHARARGLSCHALSIDYGQRHRHELRAAQRVAAALGAASHTVVRLDLRAVGASALTSEQHVPKDRDERDLAGEIPVTYVPARNMTFLAIAIGLAEARGAREVVIGVNALDYSGYPDCRPEFVGAFERAAALGTRAGAQGEPIAVRAPLQHMTKAEIVRLGASLGLDFALTHSCYDPDSLGRACARCDSCLLRRRGFAEAGVADPTAYQPGAGERRVDVRAMPAGAARAGGGR